MYVCLVLSGWMMEKNGSAGALGFRAWLDGGSERRANSVSLLLSMSSTQAPRGNRQKWAEGDPFFPCPKEAGHSLVITLSSASWPALSSGHLHQETSILFSRFGIHPYGEIDEQHREKPPGPPPRKCPHPVWTGAWATGLPRIWGGRPKGPPGPVLNSLFTLGLVSCTQYLSILGLLVLEWETGQPNRNCH